MNEKCALKLEYRKKNTQFVHYLNQPAHPHIALCALEPVSQPQGSIIVTIIVFRNENV